MDDKKVQIPKKEKERLIKEAYKEAEKKLKKANTMKEMFAKNLKQLVDDKKTKENMQQEVMSAYLGITPQALDNYCNGRRFPQIELIFRIKEFFNTSYNYLFSDVPSEIYDESSNMIELGFSKQSIRNLNTIYSEANDWGFDEQQFIINPKLFALNKLLEYGNDLLFQIGDYLLFPQIKENEQDEDLYTTLYQYKIMNALEQFIKEFRSSKEGQEASKHRTAKVNEILQKISEFENYTDK